MNKTFKSISEAYNSVKKEPLLTEDVSSYKAQDIANTSTDSSSTLNELLRIQKLLLNDPTEARKAVDTLINKLRGRTSETDNISKGSVLSPKDYIR